MSFPILKFNERSRWTMQTEDKYRMDSVVASNSQTVVNCFGYYSPKQCLCLEI